MLAGGAAAGYEPDPDRRSIEDAIAIGQSRIDATRVRFHRPYRIPVGQPLVDYIEIVTPFRRVELAAEARARAGNRLFGQREALATLAAAREQIELFVEMTFHPLNTYLGVPSYDVALAGVGAAGPPIEPREIQRVPRYGARVEGLPLPSPLPATPLVPRGSEPLLGGTVIARYDGRLLNPTGVYDVVVSESRKELVRARVDLGNLR